MLKSHSHVLLKKYIKNWPQNNLSPKLDHVYDLSEAMFKNTVNPFPFQKNNYKSG